MVGRARERQAIAAALRALPAVVVIEGEPGIGKSRLLADLAAQATADGCTVLGARASEFETDLAYALWTEALDRHLAEAGERRLARLGLADPGALASMLPAIGADPAPPDRHRAHRALRDLLERLAAGRPLVVWMDDVHWGDPESIDTLAALVRRLPEAPVLLAVAAREGQMPAALAGARRDDRVTALDLAPLSEAEAGELIGADAAAIYAQAGGNPFFLEQLARMRDAPRSGPGGQDASVPPVVAAALAAELAELAPDTRLVLDAAAVAGDPFEPGLAAAVADVPEPAVLTALDELLLRALVRPAGVPRRFAFRHPVVRHAVYVATAGGWRLAAHARAAAELERRGAGAVQLAHHVEHAARPGDEPAIELLTAAAAELQGPAPATAARFHAAALRLLPEAQRERRTALQRSLADDQAAAGDPLAARATLLDALQTAAPGERLALTVAVANQEWWLGGHEDARRRLQIALGELPAQPSADRVRLRLALSLTGLMACELDEARAHASDARADARTLDVPVFEVAALAVDALASASAAGGDEAARRVEASAAALERLTGPQVATRLPAFWMLGRARRALGQFDAALADLERGVVIAEQTGRERILLILTVESVATLIELGRIAEAAAAGEEGVERARLAGNPRVLLWALSALASARLAAGDVDTALRHAGDAKQLDVRPDFHAAGQPGWSLGAALTAAGNADLAVAAMLEGFGGPELGAVLPADRPAAAADLVEAYLELGDVDAAEHAEAGGIARAAVLLARERHAEAIIAARAVDGPWSTARASLLEGRALAASGDRRAAVQVLLAAESAFAAFGARRRRDEAVRELRRLGHRVSRSGGDSDSLLTARESEIAALAGAGRTNREIAAQLVLSTRTVEAHLRNIFGKLGVRSRVELARALQREAV